MLRYADGNADLVLVAVRRRVPRASLDGVATMLLSDSEAAEETPLLPETSVESAARWASIDWGLGDSNCGGVVSALDLSCRGANTKMLLGAVALTMARYSGKGTIEVGQLDLLREQQETTLTVREIDEDQSVEDYLALLDTVTGSEAEYELPGVGVLISEASDDRTYVPCLTPPFPLTVHGAERSDGGFGGSCWFDEGMVSARVAETFCDSVERLVSRFVEGSGEAALSTIPVMGPKETREVLHLGGRGHDLGAQERIDVRFEDIAHRFSDAVALLDGRGEITYRQLNERADRVATGLRALGVAPGSRIGICLDRDASLIVAFLGVLKAGCAYVPMDNRYPEDRLRYITGDARIPLVIGDDEHFPAVANVRIVGVDELSARGAPGNDPVHPRSGTGDDPAYVIYTSGSTGRPKGVVIPHRNLIALMEATTVDFALGPHDVWSFFHSSAFDFSVWEIWGCLLTGGRLVVVPYWTARDTDEFHKLLVEQRVTVLNQTPSAFSQLIRADRSERAELSVRLLVLGGEPLDVRTLSPWFARHSHTSCRVVNMFGITETTIHVTAQTITPSDLVAGSRSVGRALPGWSLSVRDERGRVLPPGAAGEIYVGGAGVAHGYLNHPELTTQRFVTDPETGARLYRSGDKGRLRPDGRLDHLGRLDDQVKIRGHRIELDEIRSVLASDPTVSTAVVVASEPSPGDPASGRLDAYVVLTQQTDTWRILDNARRILPDYMIPSTLTEISAVPLTANGKPDLSQLPAPATAGTVGSLEQCASGPASADAAHPEDLAEKVLGIWSHHLKTEVSMEDNFFEMGGNSLLVVRALTSMQEAGLPKITPRDFYSNSTADQFIKLVDELRDRRR
ncbi:non-ribosomal peptide synthetase [Actinomadura graeca]|uniref:non-ribosomal peptide synthetase n=1 Tax=Actinomadura graeca TaxID=2750812 RepID=UPI001E300C85|nr:amino acid adenylation domain-containing protein [Actinomadura graeca]